MRRLRMRRLVLTMLGVVVPASLVLAVATGYHVTGDIKIGGEGGGDYLTGDSTARRVYVSRATHVVVIDLDGCEGVGGIPDTPGVHGIALAPELNPGFISNGRSDN